jgi:hypothetical protein
MVRMEWKICESAFLVTFYACYRVIYVAGIIPEIHLSSVPLSVKRSIGRAELSFNSLLKEAASFI